MESPQKIGKFRVLRLLGQGAMGRVFLAEDPLIDRKVAIKVMTAEGDEEARERFRNEARAAGQMSHPNIVQLFEFGFHEGQPYLVMEYLVGESLDLWLTRPQPLPARLSVLLDLCRAIGHAHSRGVLHRDVKPSNLQVLPDGVCKLMDFGIARSRSVQLTATGTILGTPEFIAPEVLKDAGYSNRSDLFAVGLVVYQTLSGANPFHAATLEGCLMRVLTYQPPPLAEACPDVPAELSAVISSYLSKAPEERPADVRPLIAALGHLRERTLRLSSAPPLVTTPPAASISRPQIATEAPTIIDPALAPARGRQRRTLAAVLAALAAVVVLATVMSWRPWSDPDPVAELMATPPPVLAGEPAAAGAGSENDGAGDDATAGTLSVSESPPAPPAAAAADPSPADLGEDVDSDPAPGASAVEPTASRQAVPPSALPTEKAPEEGPATAAPELDSASPSGQGAGESLVPPVEQEAVADRRSGDGEDPPVSLPAPRIVPQESSTREPPAGGPSAGEPSAIGGSAGDGAQEPSGVEASTAAPRIDRLEPMVIRRGSTTALQIIGEGFGPDTEVVIRRGGRSVRALRILRSKIEGASKLRVTLLVDRQLPLGTYAVTVVGAGGRESNSIGLEVGL